MNRERFPKRGEGHRPPSHTAIILLAYAHRYLWPLLLYLLLIFGRVAGYLPAAIGFLAFSAYQLIGYRCRWRHIFCSFQNMNREKMTPNRINWAQVSRVDAYLLPCLWAICGILLLFLEFCVEK